MTTARDLAAAGPTRAAPAKRGYSTSAPDLLAEANTAINAAGPLVADAIQGKDADLPNALEKLYEASDALAHLSSLNWQASIDGSF